MYNSSAPENFRMLNPFMHSEMDFKQKKIVISCRFMSSDFNEKIHFVEQLDNALKKTFKNKFVQVNSQFEKIPIHY